MNSQLSLQVLIIIPYLVLSYLRKEEFLGLLYFNDLDRFNLIWLIYLYKYVTSTTPYDGHYGSPIEFQTKRIPVCLFYRVYLREVWT